MEVYVPSAEELLKAHELFEKKERRWRDYWQAVESVENALSTGNFADAAKAIAKFLKSWHRDYYRWKPKQAATVAIDLQQLITEHIQTIAAFPARSLDTLALPDRSVVLSLFTSFEKKLDPVGTAKTLNVLAPEFFPLWDTDIAYAYGVVKGPQGYFLFMTVVKYQISSVALPAGDRLTPLKLLDERNYCIFTKRWLP